MPDRIGQGDQRRGTDRAGARVYVCRGPAYRRKPVEGGRSGHQRTDETILSRTARARSVAPGRGVTSSSVVDLERETVARAILLGRLRTARRVEIAMGASISQKKGRGGARFGDRLDAQNGNHPAFRTPAAIASGAELLLQNH